MKLVFAGIFGTPVSRLIAVFALLASRKWAVYGSRRRLNRALANPSREVDKVDSPQTLSTNAQGRGFAGFFGRNRLD